MSMASAQRDYDAQRPDDSRCECADDCHCVELDANGDCQCCDRCNCDTKAAAA